MGCKGGGTQISESIVTVQSQLSEGDLEGALLSALKGVAADPSSFESRLLLARIFYELDLVWFSARELRELASLSPDNEPVRRLLSELGGQYDVNLASGNAVGDASDAQTLAESEFSVFDLDQLDSSKNK